ncbi:MAG: anaerobic ribonucleoside-triphosphate reductase [Fusobacteriaceae bacterium]
MKTVIRHISVIKKDGTEETFADKKIISAVEKSASRINVKLSEDDFIKIINFVYNQIGTSEIVDIKDLHSIVESALYDVNKKVALSYMNYRNYKKDFGYALMDDIENQVKKILCEVDRSNSNSNSRYISTKRTEMCQVFAKEMYQKMFLSTEINQIIKGGAIYIHDLKDWLLPQYNCALVDISNILSGGFEMENVWYNEPKDIRTAVGQVGDIMMVISAQHYGGLTVSQIDKVLAKYYEKTITKYTSMYINMGLPIHNASMYAEHHAYNDLKQSLQGLEVMLNTVVSARGSYPFTTLSFGDTDNIYEESVVKAILEVRKEGHGRPGFKKTMIFPKLVFLYDKSKHGKGQSNRDMFELSINVSSTCQYPDYIGENHKREGLWVSPMGCRAYLSNFRDPSTGKLVFTGRFNIGAVSLNLPIIFMEAKEEGVSFFEKLDYYLNIIRGIHKDRYEYLGKARASSNPLMFTQGGAYGGTLHPDDKIAPLLKSATASFGITALNELSILATGKSLCDDNTFAAGVVDFISNTIDKFIEDDGNLYALYNTPAESLCGVQVQQFRKRYGIIEGVSSREYFTNSNHLWVGEDVTMFEKQDKEIELFKKSKGGHIGYVRISNPKNLKGLAAIVERGLELGFYQGVNFNACYCEECGKTGNDFGEHCPSCGSDNITEQNRVTGYLGFSRTKGDRTINDAMMENIKDRKSM